MDIWNYDPRTGELLSQGVADPDQLAPGNWVFPAHSTTVAPPAAIAGYARVHQGGAWTLVEDHRGEVWWTAQGLPVEITDLGNPRDAGLSQDRPPEPAPTKNALAEYAMTKRDELIDGGVTFGGVLYQTRPTDRENILGASLLASLALAAGAQAGDFRWSDPGSEFEWIAMDNSKVKMDAQTVIAFGKAQAARKQELIFKVRTIKDQIEAGIITTTAQIDTAFG